MSGRPVICALAALLAIAAGNGRTGSEIPADPRALIPPPLAPGFPAIDRYLRTLTSGTTVFVGVDRTLPLVDVIVAIPAGSELDPPDQSGLALLTAALARRGGAGELDATGFDLAAEALGIEIDARSTSRRTVAFLRTPSWNLGPALDLFLDMIILPRFDSSELERIRSNLTDSLNRRRDDSWALLDREVELLRFGRQTPGRRQLTGPELDAIGVEDLERFHRLHWRPNDMIAAISGDFVETEILELLTDRLAAPATESPTTEGERRKVGRCIARTPDRRGLFFLHHPSPEVRVSMTLPLPAAPGWQPSERAALAVAAEVLGGRGGLARVQGRLRAGEGLVYQTRVDLRLDDPCFGALSIEFSCGTEAVARATAAAAEELDRLAVELIDPDELSIARRALLSGLRSSWDTAEEIVGHFAEDQLLDRPRDHWDRYAAAIASVTVNDVRAIARRHLTSDRLLTVTVGDWRAAAGRPRGEPTEIPPRDPLTLEPPGRP